MFRFRHGGDEAPAGASSTTGNSPEQVIAPPLRAAAEAPWPVTRCRHSIRFGSAVAHGAHATATPRFTITFVTRGVTLRHRFTEFAVFSFSPSLALVMSAHKRKEQTSDSHNLDAIQGNHPRCILSVCHTPTNNTAKISFSESKLNLITARTPKALMRLSSLTFTNSQLCPNASSSCVPIRASPC